LNARALIQHLFLVDTIARGQQTEAAAHVLQQHVHVIERRRESERAHVRVARGARRRLIEQKEQQIDQHHFADRLVLDAGCVLARRSFGVGGLPKNRK
jgi:diadenosine tetraphosphate (Ap4A) HIT family hydrolase